MNQPERVSTGSPEVGPDTQGTKNASAQPESNTVDQAPVAEPVEEIRFSPPSHEGDVGKLGRYRVLKLLGQGGMGAVYLGHDEVLQRKVAIKVVLPSVAANARARTRFLREAQTVARVKSDHIVTIYDVGEENGIPYLAMEYLQGYPLDHYLRNKGNIGIDQAIRIGRETALGLVAAHALGLVHRDIKPGNLWLEAPKGRVKILDFGLARQEQDDIHLTNSGAILGTPAYMSPEQADGQKVDARSDLFSLGSVLYRLTTGELPFPGTTTMAVLKSLAVKEPIPVQHRNPQVPESLAKVIHRLLAKPVEERYQSAQEVVEALENLARVGAGKKPIIVKVEPLNISVQTENVWSGIDDEPSQIAEPSAKTAVKKVKKPPLWPWLVGGLGIFAALVMLIVINIKTPKGTLIIESDDENVEILVKQNGAIIKDKTKNREIELNVGDYTIEVSEKKEGLKLSTDSFSIKRDGTETVRVRLEKSKEVAKKGEPAKKELLSSKGRTEADFHRRVAEWVLKQPGKNEVCDRYSLWISESEKLPKEPLGLSHISFKNLPKPREFDLSPLKYFWQLAELYIQDSEFDDQDFERVLPTMRAMDLPGLGLSKLAITDDAIRKLATLPKLNRIEIFENAKLTPSIYSILGENPNLIDISIIRDISDDDVSLLLKSGKCERLLLNSDRLTPKILPVLLKHRQLTDLYLRSVPFTDDELTQFIELPELRALHLSSIKATLDGVKKLAEKIPHCLIVLDGKEIERTIPNAAAERRVAEKLKPYFASMTLRLPNATTVTFKKEEPLPKSDFAICQIIGDQSPFSKDFLSETLLPALSEASHLELFQHPQGVYLSWTEADLEKLASFPFRERMLLFESPFSLSEANLATMRKFPRLIQFIGRAESITDDQVIALSKWGRLNALYLNNFNNENKLTARGWEAFGQVPVEGLQLNSPKNLGPDAFKAFTKMPKLWSLHLFDASIPDADLALLPEAKSLTRLGLAVGNDRLKSLGTISQLENLVLFGKAINDTGLTHLEGLKKLRQLNLKETAVTEQGVLRLAEKLPWCRIEWKGGVIQWG